MKRPEKTVEVDRDLAEADARMRLERQKALALEYRVLVNEILGRLHADQITFGEAARMSQTLGRGRDSWIRSQLDYHASFWEPRGDATWSGGPLNRGAEPIQGDVDPVLAAQKIGL